MLEKALGETVGFAKKVMFTGKEVVLYGAITGDDEGAVELRRRTRQGVVEELRELLREIDREAKGVAWKELVALAKQEGGGELLRKRLEEALEGFLRRQEDWRMGFYEGSHLVRLEVGRRTFERLKEVVAQTGRFGLREGGEDFYVLTDEHGTPLAYVRRNRVFYTQGDQRREEELVRKLAAERMESDWGRTYTLLGEEEMPYRELLSLLQEKGERWMEKHLSRYLRGTVEGHRGEVRVHLLRDEGGSPVEAKWVVSYKDKDGEHYLFLRMVPLLYQTTQEGRTTPLTILRDMETWEGAYGRKGMPGLAYEAYREGVKVPFSPQKPLLTEEELSAKLIALRGEEELDRYPSLTLLGLPTKDVVAHLEQLESYLESYSTDRGEWEAKAREAMNVVNLYAEYLATLERGWVEAQRRGSPEEVREWKRRLASSLKREMVPLEEFLERTRSRLAKERERYEEVLGGKHPLLREIVEYDRVLSILDLAVRGARELAQDTERDWEGPDLRSLLEEERKKGGVDD